MPIKFEKNINNTTRLAVWEITETPEQLADGLLVATPENFAKYTRNIHWLASRRLIQEMLNLTGPVLEKDVYGKPYIKGSKVKISMSHAGKYAAAMVSKKHLVGCDIEQLNEKIHRVTHKFVREDERACFIEGHETEAAYMIWSSKESLFKLYGRKEIHFLHNLMIHPFELKDEGIVQATIMKNGISAELNVNYEMLEDYMLTYTLR